MPAPMPGPVQPFRVDPQIAIAQAVAQHAARGWRVESYGPSQVTMVHGKKANHVLHLLLTVFTLGLWAPIWLILALTTKEARVVLVADEWGRVWNPAQVAAASGPQRVDERPWWRRNVDTIAAVVVALFLGLLWLL